MIWSWILNALKRFISQLLIRWAMNPVFADLLTYPGFVIVQDIFLTETAKLADVVLPAQPFTECEGTYTSGERHVQRFYPALPALEGTRPDYAIIAQIASRFGRHLAEKSAGLVMMEIAENVPGYAGLTYQKLAEFEEQWPIIGREDLYYGGTSYQNTQGLGIQLMPRVLQDRFKDLLHMELPEGLDIPEDSLRLVPVARLYDHDLLSHSTLLQNWLVEKALLLNPVDAGKLELAEGQLVEVTAAGQTQEIKILLDKTVPEGAALFPRRTGLPFKEPAAAKLRTLPETERIEE